ncbi:hypothetical protein AALB_2976 [Agarivorans albus MKT 106]|uniref:Uncharacterized protein n=1 Tax=Agarivorans albus MKT 106 TaxID=1331007 RepID=R9PTR8_AGAAL|nr:hypothetical protein AALB_2976 [Agarivorans albus MKT 106]
MNKATTKLLIKKKILFKRSELSSLAVCQFASLPVCQFGYLVIIKAELGNFNRRPLPLSK